MSGVYPVPVGRASSMLLQQRLTHQLQVDQQALLRLTSQLSSGRRLLAVSDDAASGMRGVTLQRILEQKAQARANLNTTRSYLSASESAMAKTADLINEAYGAAVRAANSTLDGAQRRAIAQEIQAILGQFIEIGNHQFRNRYLFAGSSAVRPYEVRDGVVVYHGNEKELRSYADGDQLYSMSISGATVLGGLSTEIRGTTVLTSALSESTRLADLHGGEGVILGAIAISDGNSKVIVDLTGAETIGDVVRRIEANPPANRQVTVTIGTTGLTLALDSQTEGTLTIEEVQGGTTAEALGILAADNQTNTVVGRALHPRIRPTTPLDDLIGVHPETGQVFGRGGAAFDRDAGLRIVVGDQTYVVDFRDARTVEDVLNALNGSPAGVFAQINATGNGIEIRSRVSGADFQIGENGGVTATQLGVRTFTRATYLSDLNYGRGVHTVEGADFILRRSDGVELAIDISSAVTVGDVIDLINSHPDNQDPLTAVTARLASVGNGIELNDANPAGNSPLTIIRATQSEAALDLGWIPVGEIETMANPATNTLVGRDVNPQEAGGAFNSLIRLHQALINDDLREISRAAGLLQQDLDRVTFARGTLGARQQGLQILEYRLEDETVELQRTLSNEIDADLVETISNLTARQTSLEASLRQSAATLRISLLDYL